MTFDTRRFQGPTNTTTFEIYSRVGEDTDAKILQNLQNATREDGRQLNERRTINMKTGIISQAKGSAYVEMGNTKVVCSVFDPREIPNKNEFSVNGELHCEFKFAPFSCKKRRSFMKETDEKQYCIDLRHALESAVIRNEFPNFQVDVCVIVIENDGSPFAAAITCASLALANAGIPMYDLVTAVSMGIYHEKQMIDPSSEEEVFCNGYNAKSLNENYGTLVVAYMSTLQQITEVIQYGVITHDKMTEYVDTLVKENEEVYELCRQCLVRGVLKDLQNKKETEKKK